MNNPEPMLDVARGDIAVSRQVSAALRVIATSTHDDALKRQIGEILAGRASVRDLAGAESFNRVLDGVLPAAMQKIAELSEEERDRLAEQGRAELEQFRESPNPAPTTSAPANETAPSLDRSSGPTPTPPQATDTSQPGVIPGTRKPNREQIVTPDEPDDDDLYYQDRQQRGWLQ
ncbi:hypothetical protein [Nocardia salmonicida]|uniref:hypothetical protein n=1 Tax=Nocardia salmonicida TaxID=53431 RepID=UPI0007A5599F|nr:hypothetical protein [Nocardia salmonicida]